MNAQALTGASFIEENEDNSWVDLTSASLIEEENEDNLWVDSCLSVIEEIEDNMSDMNAQPPATGADQIPTSVLHRDQPPTTTGADQHPISVLQPPSTGI